MIEIIFGGFGYGLLLSLMVGPAFFVLIESSITRGIRSALYLDLGVLISDLIYVSLAFLFFQEVQNLMESDNRFVLTIIGGAAFVIFGITNLVKAKKAVITATQLAHPEDLKASNYVMMIFKGFMINALNPGVLFYWLTLMTVLPSAPEGFPLGNLATKMMYIAVIMITFFGIDVLKIIGAKKLKDILTPAWIRVVNILLGIILVLFGTLFIIRGILPLLK